MRACRSDGFVALIAYLLLAYQKFRSRIGLSLRNLARLVQATNLFRCCDILGLTDCSEMVIP